MAPIRANGMKVLMNDLKNTYVPVPERVSSKLCRVVSHSVVSCGQILQVPLLDRLRNHRRGDLQHAAGLYRCVSVRQRAVWSCFDGAGVGVKWMAAVHTDRQPLMHYGARFSVRCVLQHTLWSCARALPLVAGRRQLPHMCFRACRQGSGAVQCVSSRYGALGTIISRTT